MGGYGNSKNASRSLVPSVKDARKELAIGEAREGFRLARERCEAKFGDETRGQWRE